MMTVPAELAWTSERLQVGAATLATLGSLVTPKSDYSFNAHLASYSHANYQNSYTLRV